MGPAHQYDVLGASQFRLLCALGLRARHRVLDFGCGSLRAGRLLIPYLDPGCYFGIEPNEWLVRDGIEKELGHDLIGLKQPRFDANDEFRSDVFDQRFDFILAQSIFSHTGRDLVERGFEQFAASLNEGGLILATFLNGTDFTGSGWVYPKCATYKASTVVSMAADSGLTAMAIDWFHPRQAWWLLAADARRLPSEKQSSLLTGVVLNVEDLRASWDRGAAAKKQVSHWYKHRILSWFRQWRARHKADKSQGV